MARIIDLDAAVPEPIKVRVRGQIYELPGDIPIPEFVELEREMQAMEGGTDGDERSGLERLEALYDRVLSLFRELQPDLDELPLGPHQLGALVVQIYSGAVEEDGEPDRPPARGAGTRSTSKGKTRRSRGSK